MEKYKVVYQDKEAKKIKGSLTGIVDKEHDAEVYDYAGFKAKGIKKVYEADGKIKGSTTGLVGVSDEELLTRAALESYEEPQEEEVPVKYSVTVDAITNVDITGAGQYEKDDEVVITITPAEGYVWDEGNAPKVGAADMVVASNSFTHTFTMGAEAVQIEITGVVVKAAPVQEPVVEEPGQPA